MHIDWWTLGLQTINVLVLVWLLSRFLFRPVAAMIEERRAAAAKLIDEARAARTAAEAENAAAQRTAADLAATRGAVLKAAQDDGEAAKAKILAAARAEADRIVADGKAEAERTRRSEAAAQAEQAGALAVDIAAKLLDRLPDAARIDGFIDGLAKAVAALSPPIRAQLADAAAPLRLKAARPLTDTELALCRARLAEVLGHEVAVTVQVDESLIAGLEIEMPHAVVRNSFRADLARISAALTETGGTAP